MKEIKKEILHNKISEEQMKYLEFLQNIIARMNSNSFYLKEVSIIITTSCFAIYAANTSIDKKVLLLPIVPTIIICFLDVYYLYLEKKFRKIYDLAVKDIHNNTNDIKLFDLLIDKYLEKNKEKPNYFYTFCSLSIWPFYISICIISWALFKLLSR